MAKTPPSRKAPARPGAAKTPARPVKPRGSRGRPAGLFTWLAVALVVVVVATLVVVKVTSGSSPGGSTSFQAVDAQTMAELTKVPASVFNAVGVTSTVAAVTPPTPIKGQPLLASASGGKTLPEVFYLGANYCPFCAAERWSTIIALSRFGTWHKLGTMESSTHSGEIYPGTPTFTFEKATYSSPYLTFAEVEEYTNQWSNSAGYYTSLQKPTASQLANFKKYDTSKWIKGYTSQQDYSIPYYSFGNEYLVGGSSFTPALLASQSRNQIAAGLKDPTSPVTAAIISTANYLTAATCVLTKNQPGSVCMSAGVKAANKALGIK
ncbi:MAG: DUF929 family protein [Acidimicrobiales bacterium]